MAGEAELKIGSASIEKTTVALDSLIVVLEKLLTAQTKQVSSNKETTTAIDGTTAAIKASEIARDKAVSMLNLEKQGLDKSSEAYSRLKGEILAQEIAAKKNIQTSTDEYRQISESIAAKEEASAATKDLISSTTSHTKAVKSGEAAAIKMTSLVELEAKGLDKLSDEYSNLKGEILAKDEALRKGIDLESKEYQQILKNTRAQEKATQQLKKMKQEQTSTGNGTKELSGFMGKFTEELDSAGKQVQLVDGPLGGIASRMTALSGIIKSGTLLWAGFAVVFALVAKGIASGAATADKTEIALKSMDAQLQATGYAAGFSAEQLDLFARSIAMSTLSSTEGVRELISSMLVFDQVSGTSFTRAIELSNDLAVATGDGASGIIKAIGKALQEPSKYYTELITLGAKFTDGEIEAIKVAEAKGDKLKAQGIILEELEGKVKGLAASQADTLSGDLDTFGQKWDEFWETAGRKSLPFLRGVTQAASATVDFFQDVLDTSTDTSLKEFKANSKERVSTLKDTQELISDVYRKLQETEIAFNETDFGGSRSGVRRRTEAKLELEVVRELADAQLEYLQTIKLAQQMAIGVGRGGMTDDQKTYLKSLATEVEQQRVLAKIFSETGDARSKSYRDQKVAFEILNAAKRDGFEGSKEMVDRVGVEMQARSDLTEQVVAENIAIQQLKAVRSSQADAQKEITLNRLIGQGLQENSTEYLRTAALIDLKNKAIAAGESTESASYKAREREVIALVDLQSEMKKVTALRQFDSNSSTYQALEKSIALNELLAKGVEATSDEYIRESQTINARTVALQAGFEVGTKDYDLIMAKADALATLQIKLQDVQNISDLGLTFSLDGDLISSESLSGIQDKADKTIEKILSVAMKNGMKLDDPVIQKLLQDINTTLQDEKNQIYLPLGLAVDEDGAIYALDTAIAVKVELDEKLREMDLLAKELGIQDEEEYQARIAEVKREYQDKENEAKKADAEKTAEFIALTRAQDVSNNISSIAENISAAKGGNKKLAQIAKAAAIFAASAGLVKQLSVAATVEPYWAKFAAYAEATATGSSIISMASSLQEPSYAFGGVDIQGAGTGRSDSIKANIAKGESVITAPATAAHKDTLRRMNAGLPIGTGGGRSSLTVAPTIQIQGDASENTVRLISESLRSFETRVQQISQGVSMETIQSEQNYGGLLNQF